MFEVLPGFDWYNLVNENRGLVVNFNYSKCKTTEDRCYLQSDGVVTILVMTSQMNVVFFFTSSMTTGLSMIPIRRFLSTTELRRPSKV